MVWLSNGKKILKKFKLFVTCRPLAFISLNGDLQPTKHFSLFDFDKNKILKVFKFYLPKKADEIFDKTEEYDIMNITKHPMSTFLIGNSYIDGDIDFTDTSMYQLFSNLFKKVHCNI